MAGTGAAEEDEDDDLDLDLPEVPLGLRLRVCIPSFFMDSGRATCMQYMARSLDRKSQQTSKQFFSDHFLIHISHFFCPLSFSSPSMSSL
jgi:hypothetical protein